MPRQLPNISFLSGELKPKVQEQKQNPGRSNTHMMAKGLTLDGSCTTQAIFGTTWGSKKPDYVKLMKAKEVNDHGLMPDIY